MRCRLYSSDSAYKKNKFSNYSMIRKTGLESENIHFQLINGPRDICVKLIVKTVFKHWQIKMCRPIDQTY